jgi:hypothetical protein
MQIREYPFYIRHQKQDNMNNGITIGSRVWLQDFNGPFCVTSIDSNKATCSHEFIPIIITPDISLLNLLEIKKPIMGFWVSFKEYEYPQVKTSNHFQNDGSSEAIIEFFYGIIQRTMSYFKNYNYSVHSIRTFQKDLETYLHADEESCEIFLRQAIDKYCHKLPREYNNSIMILSSHIEKLSTFFIGKYGDESLQITILLMIQCIRYNLDIEMALKLTAMVFDYSDESNF